METTAHQRSCSICESMCGLEIITRGDEILSIRGDKKDPMSRGFICPKATAIKDLHNDPDRLRQPVRRTKGGWEKISWQEAFDQTESRLKAIRKEHGADALAIYFGNPNAHYHGPMIYLLPLFQAMGTKNRYSASSTDQLPLMVVCQQMFGHMLLFPVPDVDHTDFFLIIGGNPVVSGGSIMTAPGFAGRMGKIQKRGGKVVVVDPIQTRTAALADQHLFITPGSDAFLLMALLHVIFEEGLDDMAWLGHFCDGLESVKKIAAGCPPEKASTLTGVKPESIRALARDFCKAQSAVCYGRMGSCVQEHGAVVTWLIMLLNIVAGKFDRPGGFMFPTPALDLAGVTALMGEKGHLAKRRSRVRGLPDFADEFPVAALAEEILTPGKGRIRGLVCIAGNPIISAPNGKVLDQALASLDFMVAMDWYVAESSRHAHIILPPTSILEHHHFPTMCHVAGSRNFVKYSPPVFQPGPETRHNWEILKELAVRMERNPAKRLGLKWTTPERLLKLGLRLGPHGAGLNPLGSGLTLAQAAQNPHGLDLGPLRPSLPGRLFTKGKRIDLAPQALIRGLEPIHRILDHGALEVREDFDLLLIGRRNRRSNNSWFHNIERMHGGANLCTAWIHPEDAAKRGIEGDCRVRVTSCTGSIELAAQVTDKIMAGVVSIPHGWGHRYEGTQLRVAQEHPGVSVNDITDNQVVDPVCGNAVFSGVPVRLEKAAPASG